MTTQQLSPPRIVSGAARGAAVVLGAAAAGTLGVLSRTRRPRAASASVLVDAPPAAVYAVLADADSYADWVVSAKEVRRHDAAWPEPGSTFHHTQGVGPLQLRDTTSVLHVDPGHILVLEVRGRPAMVATTTFRLEPEVDGRTRVSMTEQPTGGIVNAVHNPVLHRLLEARNRESLRRLKRIAEDLVS